ncbi:MAG TPA: hypothetical protein VF189_02820, partial [Patescibacteria group bacterium]
GGDYLIFGECNVNSRSYRAGQKSGMIMPHSNDYNIPQILVQNVVVKDGKKPRGLRDFVFMVLPKESLALPDAIQILSMTGGGR